jgi:ABC-type branched-subunit amino acid transport system substrate-binding protein
MKLLRIIFISLTISLFFFGKYELKADDSSWRLISWASPMGDQSVLFETLYGLKAMFAFLNANGGINGKHVTLHALEMDDGFENFYKNLDTLVLQGKPQVIVGGAANVRAKETADYFRRLGRPWFGPWTNDPNMYQKLDDDPIGIFPTTATELNLLFEFASKRLIPDRNFYLILSEEPRSKATASIALSIAKTYGIDLKIIPIPENYRQWQEFEKYIPNARVVVLWTAPGPASAITRVLKKKLPQDIIWMTNSLNPPSHEVLAMTGGAWKGTIFPAVLAPSYEIPEAHKIVLQKYALPGLKLDYPAFLGFAQGQLVAKAISKVPTNASNSTDVSKNIVGQLKALNLRGSIIAGTKVSIGGVDTGGIYLAACDEYGGWYPVDEKLPKNLH